VNVKKPVLTFPEVVVEAVRRYYAAGGIILEYGTGGSTVLASELPGKKIFAVENDAQWLCNLNTYLDATGCKSRPVTYHVNIGATRAWGLPADDKGWERYPDYALGIWHEDFFEQPDTVLIDGRFRVACFVSCALMSRSPVTVLFDDYGDRKPYHVVERLVKPIEMVDRMAIFKLEPMQFNAEDLWWILKSFYNPK
jgi:protein O-GlcNAc transferase